MLDERDVFMEAQGLGDSYSVLAPGLVPTELCSPCIGLIPSRGAAYKGRAEKQGNGAKGSR